MLLCDNNSVSSVVFNNFNHSVHNVRRSVVLLCTKMQGVGKIAVLQLPLHFVLAKTIDVILNDGSCAFG